MLPREGVVVIALGPFKALVHTEACLLFEAGKIDVSHMAPLLSELMQANNEARKSEAERRVQEGKRGEGRQGVGRNTWGRGGGGALF